MLDRLTIDVPGVYFNFEPKDYFQDPCPTPSFTQSLAKVLLDYSPGHAFLEHPRLNPQSPKEKEYRKDTQIGVAAHKLLIGRGKELVIINFDSLRSKDAQAQRDAAWEIGHEPVLEAHYETAERMYEAATHQLMERGLLREWAEGDGEVVVAHNEGDIWFRTLIDRLSKDRRTVWDYKSTGMCCASHSVASKMRSDGVDIQSAMHERILDDVDPENAGRRKHRYIFQENFEPYALITFPLDEVWLSMGRKRLAMAVDTWVECMTRNRWPKYPLDAVCPSYPNYAMTEFLEREEREADSRYPNITAAG